MKTDNELIAEFMGLTPDKETKYKAMTCNKTKEECTNKTCFIDTHLKQVCFGHEQEITHGQKMKVIRKKAEWLKFCLDIGWDKSQLDELDKLWDKFKDEAGNLKPVVASTEDQEELWQSVNSNKPKYIMLTNVHTEGMPVQWLDFWAEIENWYGDIRKRETGEQFLKRMQSNFTITRNPKQP
jgi:hypothetical protein